MDVSDQDRTIKPSSTKPRKYYLIRVLPRFILVALTVLVTFIIAGEALLAFGFFKGAEPGARVISIILNILQCAVIFGGVAWFIATTQFQPRAGFDIACTFFRLSDNQLIAEVQFILENKGFIDIFVSDLKCSIHTLGSGTLEVKAGTYEVKFPRRLIPVPPKKEPIVVIPRQFGYIYVRAGVSQVVTHIVSLPQDVEIIRITSGFSYSPFPGDDHTARRIFLAPPRV